jgi:REP-associated tyrosine transposase
MHPPRIPGFPYVGLQRYFLTFCTEQRRLVFTCGAAVGPVLEQIRQSSTRHGFANLAYCFMPDHVHLLLEGRREDADLCPCVSDAKQRSGFEFRQSAPYRLWQTGYYDHVLRDEDNVFAVVRYIFENPVRAGLASGVGEYKVCGSDVYSIDQILACPEVWSPPPMLRRRR